MHSPVLAFIELSVYPSVSLSVRPSQVGAVSKRRQLGRQNLQRQIARGLCSYVLKVQREI